ncbi:MAG: hypothetical protein AB1798_05525 [Spirochaetota bacterium]
MKNIWEPVTIKNNETYYWHFKNVSFWIEKNDNIWQYSLEYSYETSDEKDIIIAKKTRKPPDLSWNSVISSKESVSLALKPAMPDRPVVVHSLKPFKILGNTNYRFYTSIPLWLTAFSGEDTSDPLFEIPSVVMSPTWYGGATTGKLCYTSNMHFDISTDLVETSPVSAYCPIIVKNLSRQSFVIGKIAIFTDLLSVYRLPRVGNDIEVSESTTVLWTNEAQVIYLGEEKVNISVSEKQTWLRKNPEVVTPARLKGKDNIFKKSLILLKEISNY